VYNLMSFTYRHFSQVPILACDVGGKVQTCVTIHLIRSSTEVADQSPLSFKATVRPCSSVFSNLNSSSLYYHCVLYQCRKRQKERDNKTNYEITNSKVQKLKMEIFVLRQKCNISQSYLKWCNGELNSLLGG